MITESTGGSDLSNLIEVNLALCLPTAHPHPHPLQVTRLDNHIGGFQILISRFQDRLRDIFSGQRPLQGGGEPYTVGEENYTERIYPSGLSILPLGSVTIKNKKGHISERHVTAVHHTTQ